LDEAELKRIEDLTGAEPLWNISFTRPERSPCLESAKDAGAVLDLLRVGAERLKQLPRGESCGFQPVDPTDMHRADKYDALQILLDGMRRAEMSGNRLYDER
jgi:hypothetical protein